MSERKRERENWEKSSLSSSPREEIGLANKLKGSQG